jgi:hypothetical protein
VLRRTFAAGLAAVIAMFVTSSTSWGTKENKQKHDEQSC